MQTALTYQSHRDHVFAVSWSPCGRYIASGGRDRSVHIWEPERGQPLFVFREHPGYVLSVSWSPDGTLVASGCTAGTIYIWEATSGRILATYTGHTRFVRSVAWSPDGRFIASGGDYGDSTVQVWEVATCHLHFMHRRQYRLFRVCWLPGSMRVASCSFDGSVQCWDALSGAHALIFQDHSGPVYALACSSDGSTIASGGHDGSILLWSPITGQTRAIWQGHTRPIKALAWTADDRYLVSGGDDNTVLFWCAASGNVAARSDRYASWVRSLACSPAHWRVAIAIGSSVIVVDLPIRENYKKNC